MGKYREHRERRGKRHVHEQGSLSEPVYEPTYFQDSPSVTPETVDAEVIWFNATKGFGFVKLPDGAEAYLHIRVLEAAGGVDLSDGTQLKVSVERGPRGPQVAKVIDIGVQTPKTPAGKQLAGEATGERDARLESPGTVKWYNPEKGYGSIAPEDGQNDIFVNATALTRSGLSVLEEGQKVIFEAGQGKKGMEVRAIRLAQ